jgi:hypothetical protein
MERPVSKATVASNDDVQLPSSWSMTLEGIIMGIGSLGEAADAGAAAGSGEMTADGCGEGVG